MLIFCYHCDAKKAFCFPSNILIILKTVFLFSINIKCVLYLPWICFRFTKQTIQFVRWKEQHMFELEWQKLSLVCMLHKVSCQINNLLLFFEKWVKMLDILFATFVMRTSPSKTDFEGLALVLS